MRLLTTILLLLFPLHALAQGYITNLNVTNSTVSGSGTFSYLTATTVPYLDSSKILQSSAVTPTQLGLLSGLSGTILTNNNTVVVTNKTLDGGSNTLTNMNASNITSGTLSNIDVQVPDGSVSAPGLSFKNETNDGLYRIGTTDWGASVGGVLGLELRKSTSGYGNAGNPASVGDAFPFFFQRDLAGTFLTFQLSNPDSAAGSGALFESVVDAGVDTMQINAVSVNSTAPDAYNGGAGVLRATGNLPSLTLVADSTSGSTVKIYAGGTGSSNKIATFNSSGESLYFPMVNSANGAASTPALYIDGTVYTGGTNTTTKPLALIEPSGTTSNNWSTSGTMLGINAASGFSGNLLDIQESGTSEASLTNAGFLSTAGGFATGSSSANGYLELKGSSSGAVTVQVQAAAGTYDFNLPTTAGSSGQVLTSQGGGATAMTWSSPFVNPMTTKGDMVYSSDNSGTPARVGIGSTSQVIGVSGGVPAWTTLQGNSTILKAPTVQQFTVTGTQTGIYFDISTPASNVSAGATYTNNGNTYTVLNSVTTSQAGWVLFTSGTGSVSGSTLTKATGTGPSTLTIVSSQPLATYTLPTSPAPLYIKIKMIGGGGGGGGGGTNGGGQTSGGAGNASAFGTALLIANAGAGGGTVGSGGGSGGGAGQVNSPAINVINVGGGSGSGGSYAASTGGVGGSQGGSSALGGGGAAGPVAGAGSSAATNTGSGGGGGGTSAASTYPGAGGGSGSYIEAVISSPSSTYYYAVGSGGSGGSNGTSGAVGGAGAIGQIIVQEFYQ